MNPVVLGRVRAEQQHLSRDGSDSKARVVGVLVHGDAAFAGQGRCPLLHPLVFMCSVHG